MSRLTLTYASALLICLATAAVSFAQRQPGTSGSGAAGGSSAGSNRGTGSATSDRTSGSSSSSASSDRASTAAGRDAKGTHARATFEVYQDKAGEYRWRLRATNSQILAIASQGYSDKRGATNAIESIKRAVADAPIEEKEGVAAAGEDDASSKSGTAASRTGSASKNGAAAGSGSSDATTAGSSGRKTQPK
jgi:uncharacterized protein